MGRLPMRLSPSPKTPLHPGRPLRRAAGTFSSLATLGTALGLCALVSVPAQAEPPGRRTMPGAPATAAATSPLAKRPLVKAPPRPLRTDQDALRDAQAAYVRGERQAAIDLALQIAEKGSDTSIEAWRFIGLAACSVHSARLATRAYQSLRLPDDQKRVIEACSANGLGLKQDGFAEN